MDDNAVQSGSSAPAVAAAAAPTSNGNGSDPQHNVDEEKAAVLATAGEGEDVEMKDALPDDASQVIYINNLNEKIKIEGNVVASHLISFFARSFAQAKRDS